jgi:site-specific recombinase XerD
VTPSREVEMVVKLSPALQYGTLEGLIPSWERSLRAANRSSKTVRSYGDTARLFDTFTREHFGIIAVDNITRDVVETFMEDQLARWRPATAGVRFRSLRVMFKWLLSEGEIRVNPMANMPVPFQPEVLVEAVPDDRLEKLLKACEGPTFEERRDHAIIRLMNDSGIRLAECAGLKVEDVDMTSGVITVLGKGRKIRKGGFGDNTAKALDRYLRLRPRHPQASSCSAFWLGPKGALTDSGIAQMFRRRCAQAGIPKIHPHQLRHTWAHDLKARGASDGDLMTLGGWKSQQMVQRYGANLAVERALEAHKRMAPGNRV